MRQGGMKPKSHSSGVYWVRATGSNKRGGKNKETDIDPDDWHPFDRNHDGIVDGWDIAESLIVFIATTWIFGWIVFVSINWNYWD